MATYAPWRFAMGRLRILLAAATVLLGSGGVAVLVSPADAAGSLTATLSYDSDWGSGYQAKYTIANGTSSTVTSWTVGFDLAAGRPWARTGTRSCPSPARA